MSQKIEHGSSGKSTAHMYESYSLVGEVLESIGEIEHAVAELCLNNARDLVPPELREALDEI